MVVKSRQTNIALIILHWLVRKIDFVIRKLFDDATQTLRLRQVIHHLAQMELVNDVLYIFAESIQIIGEVHLQAQRVCFALQRLHGELRGVVEWVARRLIEYGVLILNVVVVQHLLSCQQHLLGGFQQHVNAPQHHHGHDDFLILAFLEGINKHICRDIPDEREQLVVLALIHGL